MTAKFDLIIRNAQVYDGLGSPPETADVAIEGGRIADIGSLDGATAKEALDIQGLALCPGFIDVHTHDDFAALAHPDMGFKSRGGVTTCIVGNCGFGAAPYEPAVSMLATLTPGFEFEAYKGHAGYAQAVRSRVPGVNIGVLAGHGTIRMAVVGSAERQPTGQEMTAMQAHLQEAMDAGVFGFSSGLIYDPGRYARTEELVELASIMRGTGALYATHMRDEGSGLLESVDEAIEIGAKAGVGVQISHHKASGRESWGLVRESLARIEAAQLRGEDVHADQYPYTAGSTALQAILDNGAFQNGDGPGGIGSVTPEDVVVASCPSRPAAESRTIADLSAEAGEKPLEFARRLAAEEPGTTIILHMMSEEDVRTVMRHPSTMIGSDGIPTLNGKPHPRLYNTFARVLGHYARDLELFDLSAAIYRMCGFPAKKFGLEDRGVVRVGANADLVVFDPATVKDQGTFEEPNQFPRGISQVLVNGGFAVRDGQLMPQRHGQLLMRAGT